MIRRKRRIRIALHDLWDAVDPRKRVRTTNDWDSPEAHRSARATGRYYNRLSANRRFASNPKALRAWNRLTHDGHRFSGICHDCGAEETDEEREELDALYEAFPYQRTNGGD